MDEIIKSGESIAFDGHLVDIGELNKDDKLPMESKVEGRISKMVSKTEGAGGQIHLHGQSPVGMPSLPICFRLSFWSSIFFSFCHLSQGLTCFPGHIRTKFTAMKMSCRYLLFFLQLRFVEDNIVVSHLDIRSINCLFFTYHEQCIFCQ